MALEVEAVAMAEVAAWAVMDLAREGGNDEPSVGGRAAEVQDDSRQGRRRTLESSGL